MHAKVMGCALALVALLGIAPAATAQSGFYLLGTVGYADQSGSLGEFNRAYGLAIPPTTDVASLSDSSTAYKLGGGYRFHPNFAVEAGWGRLGKLTYSVTRPGAFGGSFQHAVKPEALQLALVGILPASKNVEIFGKAGFAKIDNKGDITQTGGFPAFPPCGAGIVCQAGTTADDTIAMFGFGANLNFQSGLFLRAEVEFYQSYKVASVPDLRPQLGALAQAGGDIKIDTTAFSIGLGYRF